MFLVNDNSLKLKLKYYLVIKLKANKDYKKLLYYLSFFIDF